MIRARALTAEQVEFTLEIEEEDITPVRGAFDSGDKEADEQLVLEIQKRLSRGDLWAWCTVKVTAHWGEFKGTNYLGACSYKDGDDFKQDGCYPQMKDEALADLNRGIAYIIERMQELLEVV